MAKKNNQSKFIPVDNNLNAATDPWIPVQTLDGKFESVSLIDVFSKEYLSFAGDAVEQYCLMRLCETIAHSPKDNQPNSIVELVAIKHTFAEKAVEYLNENVDLFYFRGDKPFLQCTLEESKKQFTSLGLNKWEPKSIQLRGEYACGNNSLITQSTKKTYSTVAEVLLDLLVQSIFGVTFGKTKAVPSRAMMYANSPHGNLNVFLKSDNIINSIWANMSHSEIWGHSIIERDTDTSTYLNRLVPQTVYVNISDDLQTMYYCKGLEYLDLESDSSHIAYTTTKKGKLEETRPLKTGQNFKYWDSFATMQTTGVKFRQFERMDRRFVDSAVVESIAIGTIFKASMGLYSTIESFASSRYIKYPAKLETVEYKEFLEKISRLSINSKDQVNQAIYSKKGAMGKNADTIIEKVNSIFWDYLDIHSQFIFDAEGTDADLDAWKLVIASAVNQCYSYLIGRAGLTVAHDFKLKTIQLTIRS